MRRLLLVFGGFLLVSCSVNPVDIIDASGSGSAGNGAGASGGTTGVGGTTGQGGSVGGTTGQGGSVAGTTGQGGSVAGTTGQGGSVAGTTGQGGSAAGTTGQGGSTGLGGRGGTGGRGGSGGATGTAGTGGSNQTCTQLEAQYSNALTKAKMCNSGKTGQCQLLVSTSLSCPGCMTHVNDASEIQTLQIEYQQDGCNMISHVCPAIACVNPGNGTCAPGNSGDVCQ